MIDIRHYEPQSASEWNAFVAESKNGTFLFDRRYMDYHSDRFADSSFMVYRDGRLFALLPANREGDVLCSHRGLTYGGLVTGPSATASAVVETFEAVNAYLRGEGLRRVVYKAVPWIYHRVPAEEDLYALFRVCRARLVARDISSTIMQPHRLKWHRDRRYGINRCRNNGVAVELSDDFEGFWPVLEDNLMRSHGARPVHSLGEIRLLKSRFPDNILLYVARATAGCLAEPCFMSRHRWCTHSIFRRRPRVRRCVSSMRYTTEYSTATLPTACISTSASRPKTAAACSMNRSSTRKRGSAGAACATTGMSGACSRGPAGRPKPRHCLAADSLKHISR